MRQAIPGTAVTSSQPWRVGGGGQSSQVHSAASPEGSWPFPWKPNLPFPVRLAKAIIYTFFLCKNDDLEFCSKTNKTLHSNKHSPTPNC